MADTDTVRVPSVLMDKSNIVIRAKEALYYGDATSMYGLVNSVSAKVGGLAYENSSM